jgi:hypothetical protein
MIIIKNIFFLSLIVIILALVALSSRNTLSVLDGQVEQPLANFTYGLAVNDELIPNDITLVAGPWVGGGWNQSAENWLKQFQNPDRIKQIPYINLYVVAGMASNKEGLSDCNLGLKPEKTLCVNGSNFIRKNKANLMQAQIDIAKAIKKNYGTDKPIFLHFEPDFYQYQEHSQNGGRMTVDELSGLMNSWTDEYKKILPNAHLVMDVSSWNYDLKYWSDRFRNFEYGGMVGKRFNPTNEGKDANGKTPKTYKELINLSGKKMIVNDAHGPGGKWLPYNKAWENQELVKARFDDGVVAVIQPPVDTASLIKIAQKSVD